MGVTYKMSRLMFKSIRDRIDNKTKEGVIEYLNSMGGIHGKVVDIKIFD